jgi:hypothetical protein
MRWLLAGLLFALSVALAIGTAAIRAENARYRRIVDEALRDIHDRNMELTRLSVERLQDATPERLAAVHWQHLHAEFRRRLESLQ